MKTTHKVLALFLLALILRMAFLFYWYSAGRGQDLSSDSFSYYEIAKNIATGRGFYLEGELSVRRPPIYPLFLSAFVLNEGFPFAVQMTQAIIGALSCIFLYLIGRRMYSEDVGLLSAFLMAIDYSFIRQNVVLMTETLYIGILLLAFLFYLKAVDIGKGFLYLFAGFFFSLALMTREVLVLFIPVLWGWIFFLRYPWREKLRFASLFFLGFILVLGPWVVRNSITYKQFVFVTATAGHTLYVGNNPSTSGGLTGGDWEFGKDSVYPGDEYVNHLTKVQADHYLFGKAQEFIRNHPKRFLTLMAKKVFNMWRPYQTDSPLSSKVLTFLIYVPVMLLGVCGCFLSRGDWFRFFPVWALMSYTFVLHAVLIGHIRYRLPVMPFFMVFASFAFMKIKNLCPRTQR